jgi:hypothetical protein
MVVGDDGRRALRVVVGRLRSVDFPDPRRR